MIEFKKYFFFASIVLLLLISACRSSRFLEEGQYLVTKSEIEGAPENLQEEIEVYIHTDIQPNSRFNLFLYNLINTKHGRYKTQKIRKIGEAPHILDSALMEHSAQQMQKFMFNKGYFNAKVESNVNFQHKKARIKFDVKPSRAFNIEKVQIDIEDPKVAVLFYKNLDSLTQIKSKQRFDADTISLIREEFHQLMRQKGYFGFVRQHMYVDVDTIISPPFSANVKLNIQNPTHADHHIAYQIEDRSVIIRNQKGNKENLTPHIQILEDGTQFEDYSKKFKAHPITKHLFFKKNDLYNVDLENLSYDLLYSLNSFSRIKIQFTPRDSNKLDVLYDLTPRPMMANQIEGEYTFSSGMGGLNLGNIFSHRNLFGGSEQLDLQLRYGVLFDSRLEGSLFNRIFNNDFQIGVNITLPKLLSPFDTDEVYRFGIPKTIFTSNLQIFDQYGTYSNRYIVNTLSYQWMQNSKIQHVLTPLVIEYRKGILNNRFAEDLIDKGYLLYVRSNNRAYFGLGAQYSYSWNAPLLIKSNSSFPYFKGSLDFSGNLLQLLSAAFKFEENENGEKVLLGVPYLQYAKGEFDFRYYKQLGGERQLVFRINPGIAIPYGNNSSLLIFEKSYFGGGMSGLRAWQARTIGPGNYNREVLDPSLRQNLRNLDQLGELKLETNLEYRFQILKNLWGAQIKGATFLDIGNIWRLQENELNPGGEIDFSNLFNQIAIGTGAGIRADMGYFIMRLDVGLKVKDPQFRDKDQWVITQLGHAKSFRNTFYESHKPDRYRFFQYNFGIGLPF